MPVPGDIGVGFRLATYNANLLIIDPDGAARTVTLYPEADAKGLILTILNQGEAAETLTVNDDSASPVLVGYVHAGEAAVFACDGTSWVKLTRAANFGLPVAVTASGTIALTAASPRLQQIDGNGSARDVTLPALSAMRPGDGFLIDNSSSTAIALTVKDSGGSTVQSLAQHRGAKIVSTGAAWVSFPYSCDGS